MADAQENGETTEEAGKKVRAGLARRATRSLRRARAVYEGNEWQDSNEAAFLIQEANVLALMDLADAVREQQEARQ